MADAWLRGAHIHIWSDVSMKSSSLPSSCRDGGFAGPEKFSDSKRLIAGMVWSDAEDCGAVLVERTGVSLSFLMNKDMFPV